MVPYMKDYGKIICTMVVESSIMPVVTYMKVSLWMIWHRALVSTDMQTAASMSDTGTKISNTVSAKRNGTT